MRPAPHGRARSQTHAEQEFPTIRVGRTRIKMDAWTGKKTSTKEPLWPGFALRSCGPNAPGSAQNSGYPSLELSESCDQSEIAFGRWRHDFYEWYAVLSWNVPRIFVRCPIDRFPEQGQTSAPTKLQGELLFCGRFGEREFCWGRATVGLIRISREQVMVFCSQVLV
jgi:hypothetical protein